MREEIKICLDEIDACIDNIESGKLDSKQISRANGWILKHKQILKELGYKGKLRRLSRKKK